MNQRSNIAKKMIQKKQHQLLLKEITNKQPRVSKDAIIDLEKGFRAQMIGEDVGQVQIVLSQREEGPLGYEQVAVHTEWTEEALETEQLLELPHPIPERPEISPSFVIENTSRLDEPTEINDTANLETLSQDDDHD